LEEQQTQILELQVPLYGTPYSSRNPQIECHIQEYLSAQQCMAQNPVPIEPKCTQDDI
jgi:hypothetical protein